MIRSPAVRQGDDVNRPRSDRIPVIAATRLDSADHAVIGAQVRRSQLVSQASRLAGGAREVTGEGERTAEAAAAAMSAITQGAAQLAEMLDVIERAAMQTGILALNATVAAARAGDQGRGFGIVATDLRHVAQCCTTAARQMKSLVKDTVQQIGHGATLVQRSGLLLGDIAISAKQLSDVLAEIAITEDEAGSLRSDPASGLQAAPAPTRMPTGTPVTFLRAGGPASRKPVDDES
jgi:methyl-accepting chemotaxis protein